MAQYDVADIKRALRNKLEAVPSRSTSHEFYEVFDPEDPDKRLAFTWFSHGIRVIGDALLQRMAVELRLPTMKHLRELVECSLSGPDALGLIRSEAERISSER